ncbi:MAG: hypothetical protein RLP09_09580 [Sandaracinaceae bacterium]
MNLFSLFGGQRAAAESALRDAHQDQTRQVNRNVSAAAARGGVNPLAAFRTRNDALQQERSAQARQRAQMLAAAEQQQQQGISNLIGGGLGTLGTIVGMGVGGPPGAAAGSALGQGATSAVQGLTGQTAQPQPAVVSQAPQQQVAPPQVAPQQQAGAQQPPRRPADEPLGLLSSLLGGLGRIG